MKWNLPFKLKYVKAFGLKSLYFRMLAIFMSVLLITLISLGIFSYVYVSNIVSRNVNTSVMNTLNILENTVNSQLSRIQTMVTNISFHPILQTDFDSLSSDDRFFVTFELYQQFERAVVPDKLGIFYFESNRLVIAGTGVLDINIDPYSEWLRDYIQYASPDDGIVFLNRSVNGTQIVTALNTFRTGVSGNMVLVFADIGAESLFSVAARDYGSFLITDGYSTILYGDETFFSNNFNQLDNGSFLRIRTDGQEFMVFCSISDNNGWRYYSIQEYRQLFSELRTFLMFFILLFILLVVVALLIWQPMSRRWYNPIAEFVDNVSFLNDNNDDGIKAKNELDYANIALKSLTADINAIRINRPKMIKGILLSLIHGIALENNELMTAIPDFDVNTGTYVAVFVFLNKNVPFVAPTIFKEENDLQLLYTDYDEQSFLMLLNIKHCTTKHYEHIVNLSTFFKQYYQAESAIGIGGQYDSFTEAGRSAQEALKSANVAKSLGSGAIVNFSNFNIDTETANFYIDLEVELIESIKKLDTNEATKIINFIVDTSAQSINGIEMLPQTLWQMINAIMIALKSLSITFESVFSIDEYACYKHFNKIQDIESMRLYINNLITAISEHVKGRVRNANDDAIDRAIEYMNLHLSDNITMNDVAAHVNISAPYFSVLFKKHTNQTFSSYFKELRIQKVKELLLSTDLEVQAVAETVGYINYKSFLRIFKETVGLTPTEFRKATK